MPTAQNSPVIPIAVSIDTAAKMIGLGRTSFYKLLASGEINSVRCGGRVLIAVSELNALIERLRCAESTKPSPRRLSR
jgi:excisionase family DNA binding protein